MPLPLVVKVDGVDGAGKTSLIADLATHFGRNLRVTVSKEFSSAHDLAFSVADSRLSIAELINSVALRGDLQFTDLEREMLMLVCCMRSNRLTLPRLRDNNDLVLCDRSSLSMFAYGILAPAPFLIFASEVLRPLLCEDLVLWLDVEPELAFGRSLDRQLPLPGFRFRDAIEERGLAFQNLVARAYAKVAEQDTRVRRIDASATRADVRAEAIAAIASLIG